jgi:hypothetical protein
MTYLAAVVFYLLGALSMGWFCASTCEPGDRGWMPWWAAALWFLVPFVGAGLAIHGYVSGRRY